MKKRLMSFVLLSGLLFSFSPAEASNVSLEINGKSYNNQSPTIVNGRVYVPIRVISEALGHEVLWDGATQSVLIDSKGLNTTLDNEISIYVKKEKLVLNNVVGQPFITNGTTYIPLKVVSDALGAQITWNNEHKKVTVVAQKNQGTSNQVTPNVKPSAPVQSTLIQEGKTPTILSKSGASLEQINKYLDKKEKEMQASAKKTGKTFVPFPQDIGQLYYTIGQKYGIAGEYALAQAMLETGNFQFGNEVKPEQNNYCGLGAIGRKNTKEDLEKLVFSKVDQNNAYLVVGNHGWNYRTVAIGVEAHIQHIYSYASDKALPEGALLYDGRFSHGYRGKAKYWHDLNGKWAVPGKGYGERITAIAKDIANQ